MKQRFIDQIYEQVALITTFLKTKIKKFIIYVFILLCALFIISNIVSLIKTSTFFFSNKSEVFTKINYYYYTWLDFQRLTGKELHSLWNEKYHDAYYKWDGDAKNNEYDCTSAIYWILKELKSNYELSNVENLNKRLEQKSHKRKSFSEIQERDLIIIFIGSTNWHVGMVEGKGGNETIRYMDMDAASTGAAYRTVQFGSGAIRGVYPITFEIWIGDLLKNVKAPKDTQIIIKSGAIEEIKEIENKQIKKVIPKIGKQEVKTENKIMEQKKSVDDKK